jgi:hypothetical protein
MGKIRAALAPVLGWMGRHRVGLSRCVAALGIPAAALLWLIVQNPTYPFDGIYWKLHPTLVRHNLVLRHPLSQQMWWRLWELRWATDEIMHREKARECVALAAAIPVETPDR